MVGVVLTVPIIPNMRNLVESMAGIILRTSQLNPDVPISVHPASDVLGFPLAHVVVIVTAFMYCQKIIFLPVVVIVVDVV